MDILPLELLETVVSHLTITRRQHSLSSPETYPRVIADILNVRSTCRALALAATRSFVDIVQFHIWKFDAHSLNQLSNILLNKHIADHISCLRINAYRFMYSYDSISDCEIELQKAVAKRAAYIREELTDQLIEILARTKKLKELTVHVLLSQRELKGGTSRLLNSGISFGSADVWFDQQKRKRDQDDLISKAHIPDPIENFRDALDVTHLNEKIEKITIFNYRNISTRKFVPHILKAISLSGSNITHLTIEPSYLLVSPFLLHCPNLTHIGIIRPDGLHTDHLKSLGGALSDTEKQQLGMTLGNLKSVTLTSRADTLEDNSNHLDWYSVTGYSYVSEMTIYEAFEFFAEYSSSTHLPKLILCNVVIETHVSNRLAFARDLDKRDQQPNYIADSKPFAIGEVVLRNVRWREHDQGMYSKYKDVVGQGDLEDCLKLLMPRVQAVSMESGRNRRARRP